MTDETADVVMRRMAVFLISSSFGIALWFAYLFHDLRFVGEGTPCAAS